MFVIDVAVTLYPCAWQGEDTMIVESMKASLSKRECGMSFLMVFKGERVTDPGWGLLCVIMGIRQGSPVP